MVSGLLLVDKPTGITSFDVIRKARKQLQTRKIGHAGTLDPFASGLLVLAVNEATKVLSELILTEKKYVAEVCFGATSSTDDPEGEITQVSNAPAFSKADLEGTLKKFTGTIAQTPPVYSALKIKGKRACDRVRAGEDVSEAIAKKTREVEIFSLELLSFDFPKATIEVHCSSGTYIRSLARDIGAALQTGAYLSALRRTSVGNFNIENAVKIDDISEKALLPLRADHFSLLEVMIDEEQIADLKQGKKIAISSKESSGEKVVITNRAQMLGFGEIISEEKKTFLQPRKIFKTES